MLGRILGGLRARLSGQVKEDAAVVSRRWVEEGIARNAAGEYADATICFERALATDPQCIPALHGRAVMHHLAGEQDQAIELCDEILAHAPGHIDAWITRAFAARELGNLEAALDGFRRAVQIEPRSGLISCVGGVLFQQGRIDEALSHMDQAIAIDPENDVVQSNRLFILNHDPRRTREEVARAHFEWGRAVEKRMAAGRHAHVRAGARAGRLKIGYVSADLRTHSVAFFLIPILENHDRGAFEVTCYDNHRGPGDAVTERLMALVDHWVKVAQMDDFTLAQRIRDDRIDILVDLSGHTGGNRLPVFALKPAPVAASWFGYMNTTGLTTIDYRISDAALCPPGCEPLYSERIWRLPSAAAWSPSPDSPDPGPPPALARGHVRFASLNNWTKVSDDVVDAWARILLRVPGADMLVMAGGGDTDAGRSAVHARFAARGIEPARIVVEGHKPLSGFLSLAADADIALDPFPYNGGTTTLHTLWMAVPVVSLAAARETGRVAEGLLASVGLADLCAHSVEGYVDAAVRLAADSGRRTRLRAELRQKMRAGTSMNGGETTANLEKAYMAMWDNRFMQ